MRCNIEHRNPLGSIANFARHQYQDQADPSEIEPHQPQMSHCQSYQPHKRPHTYQMSSCQQTSQPRAGPNLGGAGILYFMVYADQPNLYALVID